MNKKIIGLPTKVTDQLRIVIDSNLRAFYGIDKYCTVQMIAEPNKIRLYASNLSVPHTEIKNVNAGRFNLPRRWAKQNHIRNGDNVYLLATDDGLYICPAVQEA